MTETATPENEDLVARVYTDALQARADARELPPADQVVYEIEMLSQEVNSGAAFEQYFRWASIAEIAGVVGRLESLGLAEVAALARRAIGVAFPQGLPSSDDEKDGRTDWTEEQEAGLGALGDEFTQFNGRVINVLAGFYRESRGGA